MNALTGLAIPFDPVVAESPRCAVVRAAARDSIAAGDRGRALPAQPGRAPAPARWRESLLRWLAGMPREMPPCD